MKCFWYGKENANVELDEMGNVTKLFPCNICNQQNYMVEFIYRPVEPENMTPEQLKKYELAKKLCLDATVVNLNNTKS